jgi:hypothetical protein
MLYAPETVYFKINKKRLFYINASLRMHALRVKFPSRTASPKADLEAEGKCLFSMGELAERVVEFFVVVGDTIETE